VDKIAKLREEHGSTRPFDITVLHPRPTADELRALAEMGVNRVIVLPWNRGREALAGLEAFATDVMAAVPGL
jgi:hypothetical protein